ncbi:hypothetical protein KR222_010860 [Zaprionus bogoriensis]|nr:hypothetical protein KR222_010860 [Zaprionus bogoriensis]
MSQQQQQQQQQVYSAHPALAAEQLAAPSGSNSNNNNNSNSNNSSSSSRRKATPKKYTLSRSCAAHGANKATGTVTTRVGLGLGAALGLAMGRGTGATSGSKTQPTRTNLAAVDDDDDIECDDVDDVNFGKQIVRQQQQQQQQQQEQQTKDTGYDETDHVQLRHKRRQMPHQQLDRGGGAGGGGGCREEQQQQQEEEAGSMSDLSSVISSPSASTVSSPLSTPTRQAPLQLQLQHSHAHCCHKQSKAAAAAAAAAAAVTTTATATHGATHQPQQQLQHKHQQQHHHHHHHHHHGGAAGAGANTSSGSASGCSKSKKLDPRLSPSPYRQLLPIALCLLSFAFVFATLIVYMDTTEIRHQQFRLNMSRDYELNGVAQDDPALIAFLRQIHMRKYPTYMGKSASSSSIKTATVPTAGSGTGTGNSSSSNSSGSSGNSMADQLAHYVSDLVGGKLNGAVIQSLSGPLANLITAPWLSEQLNWLGVLVEPEPRWYFALRKQNAQRQRMQVVHACVSPNPYPKEITIHNEDVRINSLHDEETSWFNSRVKCFPLYTIMLACDRTEYDLLSLGVQGHELEILQTLPFNKIKIDIISIHLLEDHEDVRDYVQSITKFLAGKLYKLQRKIGRNYFYQRLNAATSRTRKKDILLLKTPQQ